MRPWKLKNGGMMEQEADVTKASKIGNDMQMYNSSG